MPSATSDPNQMKAKDFVESKRSNFYLVSSPDKNVSNMVQRMQSTNLSQTSKSSNKAASVNKTAYTFGIPP